jgi:hypothetical protein
LESAVGFEKTSASQDGGILATILRALVGELQFEDRPRRIGLQALNRQPKTVELLEESLSDPGRSVA